MDMLKRIQRFEEMIKECKDAKLLKKELSEIFSQLDEMEVSIDKLMAQMALTKIALELSEEMENMETEERVQEVRVDVKHYLDGTIVVIDKKIPYSELFKVLCNAMDNFEEQIEDYTVIDFDMEKQQLHIEFVDEESLILDLSKWNLSEEVADVYVEGFVEYLEK